MPETEPVAPAPAGGAGTVEGAASIEALLALQAVEDPLFRKRKAMRRGQTLLDDLDALKADLLGGGVGEGRLNHLVAVIGQAREASIEGLDAVLDEIELRVLVELAKHGRFPPLPRR
jgi:hypothetical protein